LGELIRGFVLLCPEHAFGGTFHNPTARGASFRQLMYGLQRHIHVDADRVYLLGRNQAGDAAWITAIMHADLLAGAIMASSYPPVPYARQVYPLLL
ncbi:MAG: hypothetical protein KJ749_15235, partial [Planctomycetes bacterium]|nr:hypothetical protein [Planctomycetota bacterium]